MKGSDQSWVVRCSGRLMLAMQTWSDKADVIGQTADDICQACAEFKASTSLRQREAVSVDPVVNRQAMNLWQVSGFGYSLGLGFF